MGTPEYWQHVVNKLQPEKGKPTRVLSVVDEMEVAGANQMPPYFTALVNLAINKARQAT